MKNILLHVGYPKTGSSSLQKIFFESRHFSLLLCRYKAESTLEAEFLRYITLADGIEYNYDLAFEMLQKILEASSGYEKNVTNVLSEEILTAASGAYADRYLMATRLKQLFPNGKIMILVRNQMDLIRSRYEHCPYDIFCLNRKYMKPISFESWLDDNFERQFGTYLSSYEFHETISQYISLFGSENVFVGVFEEMVQKPNKFWNRVGLFMNRPEIGDEIAILGKGTHENISKGLMVHKTNSLARSRFGRVLSKMLSENMRKNIRKGIHKEFSKYSRAEIPEAYHEKLNGIYAPGNRWLIEELGLEIEEYDYPL